MHAPKLPWLNINGESTFSEIILIILSPIYSKRKRAHLHCQILQILYEYLAVDYNWSVTGCLKNILTLIYRKSYLHISVNIFFKHICIRDTFYLRRRSWLRVLFNVQRSFLSRLNNSVIPPAIESRLPEKDELKFYDVTQGHPAQYCYV